MKSKFDIILHTAPVDLFFKVNHASNEPICNDILTFITVSILSTKKQYALVS